MDKRQKALIKRCTTMLEQLDRHADTFAAINRGSGRAELEELLCKVTRLEAVRLAAEMRYRSQTAHLEVLRLEIRSRDLGPIIAVARARIAQVPGRLVPRMPGTSISDSALVELAMNLAAVLGDSRRVFLAESFPEDFLEQLVAAARALRAAGGEALKHRLEATSATKAVAALVTRGRVLARFIDVLVRSTARRDTRLLAEWRAALAPVRTPVTPRTETLLVVA